MTSPGFEGIGKATTQYGDQGFSRFLRTAFLRSAGFDDVDLDRPIVGILNTASDYTPCHRDVPSLIDAVRRGILEGGGLPLVFPGMSLGEVLTSPSTMLFRNLMAMQVEEQLKSQPMDAVVLVGGCDKTVPAELMAAASAGVPAILLVTGPMMPGSWRGERLGACTDCRRMWNKFRGGGLDENDIEEVGEQLCPTAGTCMVMGTASTMACLTEVLGMSLPRSATAPAVSAERLRIAVLTGRRAVGLALEALLPSDVMTESAFRNALVVLGALAGSTNAIIHLTAIARRLGIDLTLEMFDKASGETPVLVDCKPVGVGYLPDMHAAGGVPTLLKALARHLDPSPITVSGKRLGDLLDAWQEIQPWQTTIRPLEAPVAPPGALVALRGSLAPDGAIIKAGAATPALMRHRGRAVVFDSLHDLHQRIDDPAEQIAPDDVLVLRNIGPVAAGMPEAGSVPIPAYLARQGVQDMVRISDGRMSGTAYGTVVLHVSPEAAEGGPLGLVHTGDLIALDVAGRRIDLMVSPQELATRSPTPAPALEGSERGWRRIFTEHVLQAHLGADLDVL